jgi:hypothetical protein
MATKHPLGLGLAVFVAALAACGGGGSQGTGSQTSSVCSVSWTCSGSQCASVMGGYSGTAGPFADAAACEAWRHQYILSSVCSCGGTAGGGGSTQLSITGVSVASGAPGSVASGAPGSSVTVTGTGFPDTSTGVTVSLCGVNATVTSVSATQVVFSVPAMGASSCAVHVVTPSGTVTSTATFSVLPTPITLGPGAGAWGIAVDATSVYWTEAGAVKKVAIGGGTVTTVATGLASPQGIAVDATSVYFAENSLSGTLQKVPLAGGAAVTLASGLVQVTAIAVDATSVYWVENQQVGTLKKVLVGGGTVTTLASSLYWPVGVAVDASAVYWTDSSGSVKKTGLNGGIVTALATGTGVGLLALDATSVYFPSSYGIAKVGKSGGIATVFASGQPNMAYGIAVDGSNVYWVEQATMMSIQDGAVKKVPLAGGAVVTVTTLASGLASPKCIAVDGSNVYWTETAGPSPRKIAK